MLKNAIGNWLGEPLGEEISCLVQNLVGRLWSLFQNCAGEDAIKELDGCSSAYNGHGDVPSGLHVFRCKL